MLNHSPKTLAAILLLSIPHFAVAQSPPKPEPAARPQLTPITLDEPRAASAFSQRFPQPPLTYRQVSAEAPIQSSNGKTPLRLAPRDDSSRKSLSKPATLTPGGTIGTVAGSLGIVLGLFLLIAWCSRRLSPSNSTMLPKEAVELLGRTPLAARQQAQLVRVGKKLLLVAATPTSTTTLTEITDPAEVEHLLALCRSNHTGSASAAFREALQQLATEPADRALTSTLRPGTRGAR